jgi:uncharacterized membrane protein YdbT with pleckstrin-like domain
VSEKSEFLAQLPIFEGLADEELQALAAITAEYEFDAGATIAYQRDVVNSLYIVRNGRLYAQTVDNQGVVRGSRQYFAGQYFNDEWLFIPSVHPATVSAATDGRLLIINGRDFIAFLTRHPDALDGLEPVENDQGDASRGLSPAAWAEALKLEGRADPKSSAVNLLPDELVEFQARRSVWYLAVRLFWPILGLIFGPLLTVVFLSGLVSSGVIAAVAGLLAFVFLVIILFQTLDWFNDYFVITNKNLIHREFDLRTFRIGVVKIPIKKIQSVEILKPTLIANLLRIGSARVATAAQTGTVLFDNIDDPIAVQETLNRLTGRVRSLDVGENQATMRQAIESHFQVPLPYRPLAPEQEEIALPAAPPDPDTFRVRLRNWLAWRVETPNAITYRKHVFVLFAEAWLPFVVSLVLIIAGFALGHFTGISDRLLLLIFGFLFLIDLGWFIWQFEDWRNDTFQVTDRFVIDIDRKPFGFGESRKQAPIANVQNVNADRPGLFPTIFNYGNVYVETAGVDTDITFEKVPKPGMIQADIFQKLELQEEKQRQQRGSERRVEYGVLLDVYQQAMEQARIPRRTPRPGEFVENPDRGV